MYRPAESAQEFSIAQTRALVRDLFVPRPAIYWTDFLVSFVVGALCFGVARRTAMFSPLQMVCFLGAVMLFHRSALFVHEIAHLRAGTFRAFRIAWNLFCGIPFMMPSFLYYSHVDHHMRKHFGTDHDGEYLPLGTRGRWAILLYLCQPPLIPLLAVLRFLVLAPLGWLSPRVRRWLFQRASSLVMDPTYLRPTPSRQSVRIFRLQELGCFLVCLAAAVLLIRGRLPLFFLGQVYVTGVCVLYLNHFRTLGAHRYRNAGGEVTFVDQLLDSVNYPDSRFTSFVWAPVGLRFHALHHLFPTLPYHNLARAHRRLMTLLPADSPYRQTNSPSLVASLRQLWALAGVPPQPSDLPPVESARPSDRFRELLPRGASPR